MIRAEKRAGMPADLKLDFKSAGFEDLQRIKYVDEKIANEILAEQPFRARFKSP